MGPEPRPPIERFMEKVDQSGDCWLWTAARFSNGYGAFRVGPKQMRAHRWAYEFFIGSLSAEEIVMHTCDVKRCVNPDHLRAGSQTDNQRDMVQKRRKFAQKLTPVLADEIRLRRRRGERQCDLAEEFGVSRPTISGIVRGLYYKQ